MSRFDHVFVGGGINSLVAAAMLAGKGSRVLVVDRSDGVGGCMRTDNLTLPGFRHDTLAATFVLFATSPAYQILSKDLARHGLEFANTSRPTGVIRSDGSSLIFTTDRKNNVAQLNALSHGDGDAHQRMMNSVESDAEFLFGLLGGPARSWSTIKHLLGKLRRSGVQETVDWFGRALAPARSWLDDSFQSELVKALWAPWVLHLGLTPESAMSGCLGSVVSFSLESAGAPVARGGAGQAASAFRSLIEERSGVIRTGVEIDSIMVRNDRAEGVVTTDGEEISAEFVVASVTPDQLQMRLLKDEIKPPGTGFRHGRGNFQIHYALDALPQWCGTDLEQVALLHLADGIDSVSQSSNQAECGLLPENPTICVGQPHALDESRCPEGKAVMWVQIPDAPRRIKGDAAELIETAEAWTPSVREAFADRIEAKLASHINDFDRIKLARRALSPADIESLNVNLVGGDPYGGACTIDQFLAWRPTARTRHVCKKIRNLHHIGASVHPGPGLAGGSGYLLAQRLGA